MPDWPQAEIEEGPWLKLEATTQRCEQHCMASYGNTPKPMMVKITLNKKALNRLVELTGTCPDETRLVCPGNSRCGAWMNVLKELQILQALVQ